MPLVPEAEVVAQLVLEAAEVVRSGVVTAEARSGAVELGVVEVEVGRETSEAAVQNTSHRPLRIRQLHAVEQEASMAA